MLMLYALTRSLLREWGRGGRGRERRERGRESGEEGGRVSEREGEREREEGQWGGEKYS